MDASNFWKKIKLARGGADFNISALAREIDVKRSTLNYWAEKNKFPPLDVGYQIANLIGDDLGYLLNDTDPEEENLNDRLLRACMRELNEMDTTKLQAVLPFLISVRQSETDIFKHTL